MDFCAECGHLDWFHVSDAHVELVIGACRVYGCECKEYV